MGWIRTAIVVFGAFSLTACIDFNAEERAEVREQMDVLKVRIGLAQSELTAARNKQSSIEGNISRSKRELVQYENKVRAVLQRHPEAVTAIVAGFGGAAVAIDANNEFSEEAESVAAGVALIAGLYALGNQEEVGYVAGVMSNADRDVKAMKSRITALESDLFTQRSVVAQKQSALVLATNQHQALTQRLMELQ
ncbi:hypothetical protein [Erythrobacter sp.]|uniref:hypothetical protein n=1 Tax=Erythrobacter sp. TaxID=1042 RepID=UPI0026239718|nr:hypothetical protein [Erythrobacter sp.]